MRTIYFLAFAGVILCTAPIYASITTTETLPRTGQTTSYAAGDDGDVQAGTPWPNPRFTDNGDGSLTDNLTGLIWAQDGNLIADRDPTFDNDGTAGDGFVTWQHALDYVALLNAEAYQGHTDWRLPNINELESLKDLQQARNDLWLQSQGFQNVPFFNVWSSTTESSPPLTDWAWYIHMAFADKDGQPKSSTYGVWPVRGEGPGTIELPRTGQQTCYDEVGSVISCTGTGQDGELQKGAPWPTPRFTDNGDGTVTDNLTGLMWLKDANCTSTSGYDPDSTGDGRVSWQHALDFVSDVNSGVEDISSCATYSATYSDWRLPNANEMQSLTDFSQANPVLPSGHPFSNVPYNLYWTSTTFPWLTDSAWSYNINAGNAGGTDKSNTFHVWLVRDSTQSPIVETSKPDLIVTGESLSSSSYVYPGGTVTIINKVRNQGDANAGSFDVRLYLSDTPTYGSSDVIDTGARWTVGSLAVGYIVYNTTSVTVPTSVTPGNYYVCVVADSANSVDEKDETNNTLCNLAHITVAPPPKPDLIVTSDSVSGSATVYPGGTVNIVNKVKNQGNANAGSFDVGLYLSSGSVYVYTGARWTVSSLAVGYTDYDITSVTVPASVTPGNYYVCVIADSANSIDEKDETNNTLCNTALITVVAPPKPDLIVTGDSVSGSSYVYPGGTVSIVNKVKNQGDTYAGSFDVGFYLSTTSYNTGHLIDTGTRWTADWLGVGGTDYGTTKVTVPASVAPGNYYVCVVADVANSVDEKNETNNTQCYSAYITVVQSTKPDLIVTSDSVSGSATVYQGGTVSIVNKVKNQGDANAGSFDVGLYLSDTPTYGSGTVIDTGARWTVVSLAVGYIDYDVTPVTVPASVAPGNYYVCVVADSANGIDEKDETNNTLCNAVITVVEPPKPDLIVTKDKVYGSSTVSAGGTIKIINYIKNQGTANAGSFGVGFYLSSNAIFGDGDDNYTGMYRSVYSLGAGYSNGNTTAVTVPATVTPGSYYMCVVADTGNSVDELDETNNALCTAVITVQ